MSEKRIKEVHIGEEIKRRFELKKLSKTEFGRLIGIPQQHVNKIFAKKSIDTDRLLKISDALDFNFFSLYITETANMSAFSTVSMGGENVHNNVGDSAIALQLQLQKNNMDNSKATEEMLRDQIQVLKDNVEQLKSNLRDKDEIINLLKIKNGE